MNKEKIFIIIMSLFFLTACNNNTNDKYEKKQNDENINIKDNYDFNSLKNDFNSIENEIEITPMMADMIGATEGYKYKFSNCIIEVYKFNEESQDYKTALENQQFYLKDFEHKYNAVVKNGFGYSMDDEKDNCEEALIYVDKLINN